MARTHWQIVRTPKGFLLRLMGGNGETVLSSTTQLYTTRESAEAGIDLAAEAAGNRVRIIDERQT